MLPNYKADVQIKQMIHVNFEKVKKIVTHTNI